ncbi:helix-turn-helix domain-containing protein [Microbacterium marinum]|uniref:helix-turn-helix domain-containing protein n=2 Tax=Microbacteriaceae TaxID=85023 RepID=UPI0038504FB7
MRLAPGVAHTLLGIPADELVNQRVELQQLTQLDRSVLEVAHLDPASALEQVMTSLWQNATPNPTELDLAHSLNQAAETGTSVSGTAKQHGLSERTLRRISHRLFGYGPKTLMAIHRFQHALRLARSGSSIGEAAAVARYADQAHLSREARRLGGAPIGALIRGD